MQRQLRGIIIIIGALFMGVGCSHHSFIPANRFDFPETHGKWLWGRAQVHYQGLTRVELSPNFAEAPPRLGEPKLQTENTILNNLGFTAETGVIKKMDIFIKMSVSPAPSLLGVKYQFCGHSYDERKTNEWACAATLAGGLSRHDATVESAGVQAQVKGQSWALDGAFIGGYRFKKDMMVYGGPFYLMTSTSGQVSQSNNTSYDFSGSGNQMGFNLGLVYEGRNFSVALEAALIDLKWSYSQKLTKTYLGAAFTREF